MHNGCIQNKEQELEEGEDDNKEKDTLRKHLSCFNEVREIVIKMYLEIA